MNYNSVASRGDRQWGVNVESSVIFESIGLELVNDRAHHVGLEPCLTVMALVRPSALVVLYTAVCAHHDATRATDAATSALFPTDAAGAIESQGLSHHALKIRDFAPGMELDGELGTVQRTYSSYLAWFQRVNEHHSRILRLDAFSLADVTFWVDFLHQFCDLQTEVGAHHRLHTALECSDHSVQLFDLPPRSHREPTRVTTF